MPLPDFATIDELEQFWKEIDAGPETTRATSYLHLSSSYLRQIGSNNGIDIDEKIVNDTTGVYEDAVKLVIMSSVQRGMTTPTDAPPADQWSQSAAPYSESMRFTNPSSSLYFKTAELQMLGLSSVAGRSKFGLLRGVRGPALHTTETDTEDES